MYSKSEALLSAWGAFFVAHALSIQKIEKALSDSAPLSLHEYDVLLTIERTPDKRIRYSDLASVSIFTKSGITRILKRLESRGLIDRLKCKSDGRGAFAQLNKRGEKALKDTWAIYSEEILKILSPALTHSEAKDIEKIMGKLIDEVRAGSLVRIGSKKSDQRK
jgi:DNA-binding MarR family transcriptional regulator